MTVDWAFGGTLLIRIGIASVLGGLIGLERERANQTAGLRTHILICLGSALVMCTGEYMFKTYSYIANIDPARLGAQVVSGVGVLCAGTIMKEKASEVTGLTTATGLWCSACIGLAVSCGNIVPAVGATVIALVVLRLFRLLENRNEHKQKPIELKLTFKRGEQIEQVTALLQEQPFPVDMIHIKQNAEGMTVLYCRCRTLGQDPGLQLLAQLGQMEDMAEAEILTGEMST